MFAFTGFDFVEGTCYKHLAKGKQRRGALGGTEDDFTAPSEPPPSSIPVPVFPPHYPSMIT